MDQNNPAESKVEYKGAARWRLILLVLCAVGAGLVAGILVLQFAEYRFYKAAPNVWPQPGAGGMVSAPAAPTKLSPVTTITSSAASTTVSAPAPALAPTSAPVATVVSTSAPAAVKP